MGVCCWHSLVCCLAGVNPLNVTFAPIIMGTVAICDICPKLILKSNLVKSQFYVTSVSVVKSFWNFSQSTAVSLPCSGQNFQTIWQMRNKLRANKILQDLSLYQVGGMSSIATALVNSIIIPPASTKLIGGYTGITLSVCPSVDRIVSALYLQQYSSDPFHICTSYQATWEGVSRVMPVSKFPNLKFWRIF